MRVGWAYETYGLFLFANEPKEFDWRKNTNGYIGQGAICVIRNAPTELLVLAQND